MVCFKPMQAIYNKRADGKLNIKFSDLAARSFYGDNEVTSREYPNILSIPCSQCIACRLERSRQWATRAMHEASLYEDNSFITLTYNNDFVPHSLDKRSMQLFMKRLRRHFPERKIRSFYCGEYGEKLGRPHYHAALFNIDFDDKEYWKTVNGNRYYTSDRLNDIWTDPVTKRSLGYSVVGDLTFESAAYIARYCTKKITGAKAEEHYTKVLSTGEVIKLQPEFCQASRRPGLGNEWFQKYGMTDVYPLDEVIVRGAKAKPPRYYDKLLERSNVDIFNVVKLQREERRDDKAEDNVFKRLLVKQKCQEARMKQLVRTLEAQA